MRLAYAGNTPSNIQHTAGPGLYSYEVPTQKTCSSLAAFLPTSFVQSNDKQTDSIDYLEASFRLETLLLLNIERLIKLELYLQTQVKERLITQEQQTLFRQAAHEFLRSFELRMGVPDAMPGPDGQMMYYAKKDATSMQLDVLPSGEAELYIRNHRTNLEELIEYRVGELASSADSTKIADVLGPDR